LEEEVVQQSIKELILMRKLLWNSVILLSGVILLAALALILSLLTSRLHQSQANSPTMPSTRPTLVVTPRSYPNLDPESVSILTTDWPVFKNWEFGFQIRYPPTFFTKEWQVDGDRLFYVSFMDQKWRDIEGEIPDIGLVIYGNPQGLSLDEWFHKHSGHVLPSGLPEGVLFVDPTQVESVSVRGHTALRFIDGGLAPAPSILIDRGPQMVKLYFAPVGPDNLEPIYELMLSTLEFIK
jgi:hypothetical protein